MSASHEGSAQPAPPGSTSQPSPLHLQEGATCGSVGMTVPPNRTPIDDNAALDNVEPTKSKETTDVSSSSSINKPPAFVERKRVFWIIPIPKRMRYHPDRPFHFSLATNYLFAFVCYYFRRIFLCEYADTSHFSRPLLSPWPTCR